MSGATVRMPRKQPSMLTRNSRSKSAVEVFTSSENISTPALFTSTLTGPKVATASSTAACQLCSSETSRWTWCADSPSSSASAFPRSSAMSAITTLAPSATKARAAPSPCPCAAPVMMATLPSRRPMSDLQLHDAVRSEADRGVAVGEERPELLVEVREVPGAAAGIEALLDFRGREESHHPAVHDEDLAVDPLGGGRGEVGDQRSHVAG